MPAPNTLEQFFAPVSFGQAQPKPAGTRLARPEQTTAAPIESVPLPSEDPDAWDLLPINGRSYPPQDDQGRSTGIATVKFSPKAKLDKQAGAGAPKAKVKKTGAENTKIAIGFKFNEAALPAMMALANDLQPGSGPHTIGGPKAKAAKVDRFQVESWDDAPGPMGDGWIGFSLQCVEVKASAQNGAGGGPAATLAELEAAIAALQADMDAKVAAGLSDFNPAVAAVVSAELDTLRARKAALEARRDALQRSSGGSSVTTPQVAANQASGTLASVTEKKTAAQGAAKP